MIDVLQEESLVGATTMETGQAHQADECLMTIKPENNIMVVGMVVEISTGILYHHFITNVAK